MLCESAEYESMQPYMYNKVSGVRCLILNSSIHSVLKTSLIYLYRILILRGLNSTMSETFCTGNDWLLQAQM